MKRILKLSSLFSLLIVVLFSSCAKNEVTGITLNKSTSNLILGQTDSLTVNLTSTGDIKNISRTWSSNNLTVATVSSDGLIQAKNKGTATITIKVGGKSATCLVTVVDQIESNFTSGALFYWGDYYGSGKSNNFVVYLLSATDTLLIEMNTDLTAIDSIPSGTYNMIVNVNSQNYNQFIPNTLVPANFTDYTGSWYYNKMIFTPVMEGNTVVTNTNNNYSIQYNLVDYFGNSISGNYQGTLSYYDKSKQSAPALKSKAKANRANRMTIRSGNRQLLKR